MLTVIVTGCKSYGHGDNEIVLFINGFLGHTINYNTQFNSLIPSSCSECVSFIVTLLCINFSSDHSEILHIRWRKY